MKKIIAMLLALVMVFALCACGSQPAAEQTQAPAAEESKAPAEETPAAAEDTITVMVPPVTGTYLDDIDKWAAEFTEMYPNLHIEVIKTSWDDHNSKLSTMATSGEAPDIAEVSYSTIGSLVEPTTWMLTDSLTTTRTPWTTCPSKEKPTVCPST